MQTTVELQGLYDYSIIPLIITTIATVALSSYLIFTRKNKAKVKEEKIEKEPEILLIPERNIKNIPAIKEKYFNILNQIEYRYQTHMIGHREAHLLISEAIRTFIFEVTDITTQNYSLNEIKKLNIPGLYELIEEYYEPEFAKYSQKDFKSSIEKARRVIYTWN